MTAKYVLFAFGLLIIESVALPVSGAPAPNEKPVITCELKVTDKDGEFIYPDGGEVTITNNSAETIDIGTTIGPMGLLDLKVRDPNGETVKTATDVSFLSPRSFMAIPVLLKSGESYSARLGLLHVILKEVRVVGTYKVRAVFTFEKKVYESAEVELNWPGEAE